MIDNLGESAKRHLRNHQDHLLDLAEAFSGDGCGCRMSPEFPCEGCFRAAVVAAGAVAATERWCHWGARNGV